VLKNFGFTGLEEIAEIGGNAKMNEFQAAMGICNLKHFPEEIEKRGKVVDLYRRNLSGITGIKLNLCAPNVKENFAYFPVIFDQYRYTRDQIFEKLSQQDIFARKYFYPTINSFACYRDIYNASTTPIAKYIAEHVLTLPLFADLSLDDVDRICDIITK